MIIPAATNMIVAVDSMNLKEVDLTISKNIFFASFIGFILKFAPEFC